MTYMGLVVGKQGGESAAFFNNCIIKFIDGRPRIVITRAGAESEGIL